MERPHEPVRKEIVTCEGECCTTAGSASEDGVDDLMMLALLISKQMGALKHWWGLENNLAFALPKIYPQAPLNPSLLKRGHKCLP